MLTCLIPHSPARTAKGACRLRQRGTTPTTFQATQCESHRDCRGTLALTVVLGAPPHGRRIDLTFASGQSACILLDQGFGAWKTQTYAPFPFEETAAKQASALTSLDVRIAAQGDTYAIAQRT